jgi:FAD/FMN-containing dehydrogenase
MFDVSLPIRAMQAYVASLRASLDAALPGARLFVFGHLGDGNLHLGICAGPADGSAHSAVEALVYRPLAACGGSISAEHGIGLEKKPYLNLSRSAAELALMRSLKATLDPGNILNPGKIFDPD